MKNESTYWITLAHLPGWGYGKINSLIVKFFHEEKISIEEFFGLSESEWRDKYQLDAKSISDLHQAKTELPNNAFLAENLSSQGYELIPITSPEYSKTLKQNLKAAHAPALLYVKGNKRILSEKSIAIVGSRAAASKSLGFTDNIAKKASKDFKVVISGFAKGVDKQALDSALKYRGQSIIVLPQGITTFNSGFKTYYKQIVEGDVLVVSVFHPNSGWSVGLAMSRNPVIYGLADEIYVAESSEKGGTWSGVIDGLRKGRKIFVRMPEASEQNANELLIQKGAIPVDFSGIEIENTYSEQFKEFSILSEPQFSIDIFDHKILDVISEKSLSAKDILEKSKLNWPTKKLINHLKRMDQIEMVKKGGKSEFKLKKNQIRQTTLF